MEEGKPPNSTAVVGQEQSDLKTKDKDIPGRIEEDPEFQQFVKSVPPQFRGLVMQMTRTQVGRPLPHPLLDKFTPEHIDKFLDYSHRVEENAYSLSSSNRWFHLIYALAFLGSVIFLIIHLAPTHEDLLVKILTFFGFFAGGFGAGFGVKTYLERKK